MNWTKIISDALNWLIGGGGTLTLAVILKNWPKIIGALENFADQTKTNKDNQVVDRIKSTAQTLVTAIQPLALPGADQKKLASQRLVELAKDFNADLDSDKANDYIEEAYQLNYGVAKATTSEATQLTSGDAVKAVQVAAADYDLTNPPAITLADGDAVKIGDKTYTLNTSNGITLTAKEG